MNFQIIDPLQTAWPVEVDLASSSWTADVAMAAGTPFGIFPRGQARRDGDGNIVLVTGLWSLVLENSPRTDADATRPKGSVRIENSLIGPWTRGVLSWVSVASAPAAQTGIGKDGMPRRTGSLRADIVATMRALMPCSLGDAKWNRIEPGSAKSVADKKYTKVGTSCLILPGFVSKHFGAEPYSWAFKGQRRIDEHDAYMKSRSLNGTGRVRDKGKQFNAWVKATGSNLPRPGDVYALLDRDAKGIALTDRDKDGIGHVGIVLTAGPTLWETADLGQKAGWDGEITTREYHAGIGELFGQTNQPGATKFRVVAGWVNVEDYFPGYKGQMANMPPN